MGRHWLDWVVFFAILSMVAWTGFAANALEIKYPNTRGGLVSEVINDVKAANERGELVRITSRNCISACTLWLTADNMCVSRRTQFKFHCAQINGKCAQWQGYNQALAINYANFSPLLAETFLGKAANSNRLYTIKGNEMIDTYGAKECGND